jgi:hypothetical protein
MTGWNGGVLESGQLGVRERNFYAVKRSDLYVPRKISGSINSTFFHPTIHLGRIWGVLIFIRTLHPACLDYGDISIRFPLFLYLFLLHHC